MAVVGKGVKLGKEKDISQLEFLTEMKDFYKDNPQGLREMLSKWGITWDLINKHVPPDKPRDYDYLFWLNFYLTVFACSQGCKEVADMTVATLNLATDAELSEYVDVYIELAETSFKTGDWNEFRKACGLYQVAARKLGLW